MRPNKYAVMFDISKDRIGKLASQNPHCSLFIRRCSLSAIRVFDFHLAFTFSEMYRHCKNFFYTKMSKRMKPLETLNEVSKKKIMGRPKSDNPRSEKIVISLTPAEYDRAAKVASRLKFSLSDIGRQALRLFLRPTAAEFAQEKKQLAKPAPPSGSDGWTKEL